MRLFKRQAEKLPEKRSAAQGAIIWQGVNDGCPAGYVRMDMLPEIQTACLRIAELIGSMTIYLMSNTDDGDIRIQNELSRMVDITPYRNMPRTQWMTGVVMNMLLYGKGNSVVIPHTHDGYLESLEPVAADRVQFIPEGMSRTEYRILIDGVPRRPEKLLHFVYNPDPLYLWKGQGVTVTLKDVADNLKQAQRTVNAFMASEWKPSIIVKVSGMTGEMATPEGRAELLHDYVHPAEEGQPWLIPGEVFDVTQVKPLSVADLAIADNVTIDKKTVASVIGIPAFLLGVGEFSRDEWNNFVQTKLRAIALTIQQELTRALITSPKWYWMLNFWSLIDYDLKSVSDIMLAGADRGYINGDEWRDRMHMAPAGLKEYKVLENYIPADMSGKQKKLVQDES